jgi:hypothetical protein
MRLYWIVGSSDFLMKRRYNADFQDLEQDCVDNRIEASSYFPYVVTIYSRAHTDLSRESSLETLSGRQVIAIKPTDYPYLEVKHAPGLLHHSILALT